MVPSFMLEPTCNGDEDSSESGEVLSSEDMDSKLKSLSLESSQPVSKFLLRRLLPELLLTRDAQLSGTACPKLETKITTRQKFWCLK